jgi:iron complex transport system substrate-binding protein
MKVICFITALALILCSCRNGAEKRDKQNVGLTPASSRLVIEEKDNYYRVVIRDPWQNTRGTELEYFLLPRGETNPGTLDESRVIHVPVERIICMSTTHVAMLSALGAADLLAGVSGPNLFYDTIIREAVASGSVRDVGYEGNLNNELIVALKPDVVMAYGVADPSSGQLAKLSSLGIRVIYNADYLEEHPLSRAAWIRLFGLLTGRQEKADSLFAEVSVRYNDLAARVRKSAGQRPAVLLGAPWEDVWYVSPANSYTGRLIEDAGGDYLFSDLTEANSVPYSVEAVFRRAAGADVWINPGTAGSLEEISVADHRLSRLPVCRAGDVWNNRKRMTPAGGNDYWETAVVRPDILLMDMVAILHPEMLPGYTHYFYRRLE